MMDLASDGGGKADGWLLLVSLAWFEIADVDIDIVVSTDRSMLTSNNWLAVNAGHVSLDACSFQVGRYWDCHNLCVSVGSVHSLERWWFMISKPERATKNCGYSSCRRFGFACITSKDNPFPSGLLFRLVKVGFSCLFCTLRKYACWQWWAMCSVGSTVSSLGCSHTTKQYTTLSYVCSHVRWLSSRHRSASPLWLAP